MKTLIFGLLLFSSFVSAQSVFVPNERPDFGMAFKAVARPIIPKESLSLNREMRKQLEAIANVPKSCEGNNGYQYLLSLTMRGDYQECLNTAIQCSQTEPNFSLPSLIQGARCGRVLNLHQKTMELFRKGFESKDYRGERVSAYILEFATFTEFSIFSELTDEVINRHPTWTSEEKKLAKGLVEYLGKLDPKRVTKDEVLKFIEREIQNSQEYYQRLLKVHRMTIAYNDYRIEEGNVYLLRDAEDLVNPLDWWYVGYQILYRMSMNADFEAPRGLYESFFPYANARTSLPTEQNVHNYTEIYQNVCPETMLSSEDLKDFKAMESAWKNGHLSFESFLINVEALLSIHENKSDLLSVYAGLLSIKGEREKAQAYYWQSHKACAYNNRSHWGLVLLERFDRYKSYPEYESNEARVLKVAAETDFPTEASEYFLNWKSFPQKSQNYIKYGSRIWAPFIKALNEQGYKSYIKLPFDLLSESPNLQNLRDTRIGPPNMPNYQYDNRLWDDVRGVGGRTVVADHDEVSQTVHGAYNLLGHEMAHQFHYYLREVREDLSECLDDLYARAKERNLFPDGYAASNVMEYFAQGVTYYLVPSDSPSRFGINASWITKFDPDLEMFIKSMEASEGNVEKIACPI